VSMTEHDPLDIRGNERSQTERREQAKLQATTEAADIKWLMKGPRGRRIVWRQLENAGVFKSSFNPNAMTMAFAEGQRNEGLRLLGLIHQHCSELYDTMVKESIDGRRNHADD
jgi:hypothetical protein